MESLLRTLEMALPVRGAEFTPQRLQAVRGQAAKLEDWAVRLVYETRFDSLDERLSATGELVAAKSRVDRMLRDNLLLRTVFAGMPAGEKRRKGLRAFLRITSELIHLSGRMRSCLYDNLHETGYFLAREPEKRLKLLDRLAEKRLSIGGVVFVVLLTDPPQESAAARPSEETRLKVLRLIAAAPDRELLPQVATFFRREDISPRLRLAAAQTIRALGLPQDPRPGEKRDASLQPILASEMLDVLRESDWRGLADDEIAALRELTQWLAHRAKHGVTSDSYTIAGHELKPGDWLLMRNPSPYNRFTDLSPGLFTHVGVVTTEEGKDGRRRFVIADLPERGASVPATNLDAYLLRTLHYFFVRHRDPDVGHKMGQVARQLIGRKTQFDLKFETKRARALRGRLTEADTLNTYCAGFLLLCAQETDAPEKEFFPIPEYPASELLLKNLKRLGMAIGDDFVSPTGPLFSNRMKIVAARRPMYDPTREIKEAIYDHFAESMARRKLTPSPDAIQLLRQNLASVSKSNAWLRRALARINNVSDRMDLEAAAKAAAVIETLDSIGDDNMSRYIDAFYALRAGPISQLKQSGEPAERIAMVERYRRAHADLLAAWTAGRLSPHELQRRLIDHYIARGRRQLDERFFAE